MNHPAPWLIAPLLLAAATASAEPSEPAVAISSSAEGSVSIPQSNVLRTCGLEVALGANLNDRYDVYWVFNPATIQFVPYAVGPASDQCESRAIPEPPVFDDCDLDGDLYVDGYEAAYCYESNRGEEPGDQCDRNQDGTVDAEEQSSCDGPADTARCDDNGDGLVDLEEENRCTGGNSDQPNGDSPYPSPEGPSQCDADGDGEISDQEAMECGQPGPQDPTCESGECEPMPQQGMDPVACDMNGDGEVDGDEAAQCEVPPAECDSDGNGSVSVSEAESCAPPAPPCDTNGDGTLDAEEMALCPAATDGEGD